MTLSPALIFGLLFNLIGLLWIKDIWKRGILTRILCTLALLAPYVGFIIVFTLFILKVPDRSQALIDSKKDACDPALLPGEADD